MKVIVRCRATLYERDGAFQVYVNDMFPDGIGSAQLAFEQLKAKLEQEGLFAPEHKKPLPRLPQMHRDRYQQNWSCAAGYLQRHRWRGAALLCPVNVQGFEAAKEIAAAITGWIKAGKWIHHCGPWRRQSGRPLGRSTRRSLPGQAYRCKTPLISAIGTRDRFHDSGLCCRSACAYPLCSGRAGWSQTGRNWSANYTT